MSATERVGFVEKHLEKIVLGVGLLLMLTMATWVFSSPRTVQLKRSAKLGEAGKPYPADEVGAAVNQMCAEFKKLTDAEDAGKTKSRTSSKDVSDTFNNPAEHVDAYGPWVWPRKDEEAAGPSIGGSLKLTDLRPLLAPQAPLVKVSRESLVIPQPVPPAAAVGAAPLQPAFKFREVIAVHGAAVFERGKLLEEWRAVLAEKLGEPKIIFAAVEVRRRHLLANGFWSAPKPIARRTSDPTPIPDVPDYDGANGGGVREAKKQLEAEDTQQSVVMPPYWEISAHRGEWKYNKPCTKVSDMMKPAPVEGGGEGGVVRDGVIRRLPPAIRPRVAPRAPVRGGRGAGGPVRPDGRGAGGPVRPDGRNPEAPIRGRGRRPDDMGPMRPEVPVELRPIRPIPAGPDDVILAPLESDVPLLRNQILHPSGLMEVWFHDTSVEQDMIYSYQLRLVVINPFVAQRRLVVDQADAAPAKLATQWSAWSESVKIDRPTKFFVTGGGRGVPITVAVFTYKWGRVMKQSFSIQRGQAIGEALDVNAINPQGLVKNVKVDFSTGVTAVDFNDRQRIADAARILGTTTELLYLDYDGQLRTRTRHEDRESPEFKELDKQSRETEKEIRAAINGAGGG